MAKKKDAADGAEDGEAKGGGLGGKLKLVAMILPTVLLVVGAVYFLVLAPKGSSATTTPAAASPTAPAGAVVAPETGATTETGAVAQIMDPLTQKPYDPGKIFSVDPVTVNLAGGHYLKVGLGLQQTATVAEDVSPAPAIDCIISEFSGKTVDELATKEGRDAARNALLKMIYSAYEKEVYKIFYNSFVMN